MQLPTLPLGSSLSIKRMPVTVTYANCPSRSIHTHTHTHMQACMCTHTRMHTHFFNVEVYILYSQKCLQGIKFCGLQFWQESTNIVSTKTFGTCHSREVSTMSLLRYFSRTSSLPSSGSVPSLTPALHKANKRITSLSREADEAGPGPKHTKNTYPSYSTEDSARIGRHAAEHGPTKASRHFTAPESTARLLKKKYLAESHDRC